MKPAIARPGGNSSAEARAGTATLQPNAPAQREEPRTGVVRKVNVQRPKTSTNSATTAHERREAGSGIRSRAGIPSSSISSRPTSAAPSGMPSSTPRATSRAAPASVPSARVAPSAAPSRLPGSMPSNIPASSARGDHAASRSSDWRCLEWGERKAEPSSVATPRVSIAQITSEGALLRQSGPDEDLPETAEFVHRVSTLIAQSLGFRRCRALCLRGPNAALSVSETGHGKVMSVMGPLRQMANVLRRMDLE